MADEQDRGILATLLEAWQRASSGPGRRPTPTDGRAIPTAEGAVRADLLPLMRRAPRDGGQLEMALPGAIVGPLNSAAEVGGSLLGGPAASEEAIVEAALGYGGAALGGGAARAGVEGVTDLGTFIGRGADNWDFRNEQLARDMRRGGASSAEIQRITGIVFTGRGEPLIEIPDLPEYIPQNIQDEVRRTHDKDMGRNLSTPIPSSRHRAMHLRDVYQNPGLAAAHPYRYANTDVGIRIDSPRNYDGGQQGFTGYFMDDPRRNTGSIGANLAQGSEYEDPVMRLVRLLAHEGSHLDQARNPTLSGGSSPDLELEANSDLKDRLAKLAKIAEDRSLPRAERQVAAQQARNIRATLAMDKSKTEAPGFARYMGNEGEQFANAAMARAGKSLEELRNRPVELDFLRSPSETLYPITNADMFGRQLHTLNPALSSGVAQRMALDGESPQRIWETTGLIWHPDEKRWIDSRSEPNPSIYRFGSFD